MLSFDLAEEAFEITDEASEAAEDWSLVLMFSSAVDAESEEEDDSMDTMEVVD